MFFSPVGSYFSLIRNENPRHKEILDLAMRRNERWINSFFEKLKLPYRYKNLSKFKLLYLHCKFGLGFIHRFLSLTFRDLVNNKYWYLSIFFKWRVVVKMLYNMRTAILFLIAIITMFRPLCTPSFSRCHLFNSVPFWLRADNPKNRKGTMPTIESLVS